MGVLRALQGFQGTIGQPTAQVIDGSLKFDSASSQYLSSTSTFQNTKSYEMTFSFWLKRCATTAAKATQYIFSTNVEGTIFFDSGNSDKLSFNLRGSSGSNFFTTTSAELRDFSSWYHVVVALNLGNGTQSQRFKCYINNVEQTMSNTSYPSNAYHTGGTWYIGAYGGGPSHFPDYYLSNFYCISGQVLDPSYFGFTDPQTNTWRPKKYTGTFTFDNSFYLPLDNEDDFGKDKSGEGNHFTQNNFSGTSVNPDIVKDSPSGAVFGGRGQTGITTTSSAPANHATLNPLSKSSNTTFTLSDGNLTLNAEDVGMEATLRASTGKFYFETKLIDWYSSGDFICSLGAGRVPERGGSGGSGNSLFYPAYTGYNFTSGVRIGTDGSAQGIFSLGTQTLTKNTGWALGDMIGVAVDCDRKKLQIYHNGAKLGNECDLPSGESEFSFYAFAQGNVGDSSEIEVNFGQKPFKYAPPQGFLPLNSATVRPNKVIARPDQYVGVTLYTGNGGTQSINSLNMDPDLVWIKNRDESVSHFLYDSVRGANKYLRSDGNFAEDTGSSNELSFIHKGFTVNGAGGGVNKNTIDFVSWAWKAGGNKNTFNIDDVGYATAAAAGLNGGTATVTGASVGTKQGFSIIKFHTAGTNSGATISHGLSKSPDLIVAKALNVTLNWKIYHSSLGNDYFLEFDSDAKYNVSNYWGVTSSVFEADASGDLDLGSPGCISYIWHDIPGLQKFGKYVGNNNANGPYVELGFRPALLWVKRTDSTGNWVILDTRRNPSNPVTISAYADTAADGNYDPGQDWADILSNGFKIRATYGEVNASSGDYIYCAWAEAPASNLFGGQSNAR